MVLDADHPKTHYETKLPQERDDIFRWDIAKLHQQLSALQNTVTNSLVGNISKEKIDRVTLWNKIDYISSTWAVAREVLLDGNKVWVLLRFESQPWRESKAMLVHATTSTARFTEIKMRDTPALIPNIPEIEKYFDDYNATPGNKKRQVTLMVNGPTFEAYGSPALTGVNYDNWQSIGSESRKDDKKTDWKGMGYISGGKMILTHSSELTQDQIDQLVQEKRDIFTMSSLKRNDLINSSASLRTHINSHFLVQFTDGTMGELIMNNTDAATKKAVVTWLTDVSRMLYADSDAYSNYLDGMRIQTQNGIKYTHPDNGDIFRNTAAREPAMVEDNIPALLIFYTQEK